MHLPNYFQTTVRRGGNQLSALDRLVRRIDPHISTFERLHQLRARCPQDLARDRTYLKKCVHRIAEISDMLEKSIGVTISLVYYTLGRVAAKEPVVLQRSGVSGANRFHALNGETFEFLELAIAALEPSNALNFTHWFCLWEVLPQQLRDTAA